MNQNIWGPNLWFSLHTMTFTYPLKPKDTDKQNTKTFFHSLQYMIPCSVCRKNYVRHLQESPIDEHLESRKKLVFWLIDIHNMVNGETGKKILSHDVVIRKYEKVYGKKLILEGDVDMDENDESLSYHLLYDSNGITNCFKNTLQNDWIKMILIILFILLILCYIKKYCL